MGEDGVFQDTTVLDSWISTRDFEQETILEGVIRQLTGEDRGPLHAYRQRKSLEQLPRDVLIRLSVQLPRIRGSVSVVLFKVFRNAVDIDHPHTYERVVDLATRDQWDEIKRILSLQSGIPLKKKKKEEPQEIDKLIEGKRILVVGGRPQSHEMYQRQLKRAGAAWTHWIPGKEKHAKIGDMKVDIIVLLRQQIYHKTQDAIVKRIEGGQEKIVVLDKAGEGFLSELLEKLAKRAGV